MTRRSASAPGADLRSAGTARGVSAGMPSPTPTIAQTARRSWPGWPSPRGPRSTRAHWRAHLAGARHPAAGQPLVPAGRPSWSGLDEPAAEDGAYVGADGVAGPVWRRGRTGAPGIDQLGDLARRRSACPAGRRRRARLPAATGLLVRLAERVPLLVAQAPGQPTHVRAGAPLGATHAGLVSRRSVLRRAGRSRGPVLGPPGRGQAQLAGRGPVGVPGTDQLGHLALGVGQRPSPGRATPVPPAPPPTWPAGRRRCSVRSAACRAAQAPLGRTRPTPRPAGAPRPRVTPRPARSAARSLVLRRAGPQQRPRTGPQDLPGLPSRLASPGPTRALGRPARQRPAPAGSGLRQPATVAASWASFLVPGHQPQLGHQPIAPGRRQPRRAVAAGRGSADRAAWSTSPAGPRPCASTSDPPTTARPDPPPADPVASIARSGRRRRGPFPSLTRPNQHRVPRAAGRSPAGRLGQLRSAGGSSSRPSSASEPPRYLGLGELAQGQLLPTAGWPVGPARCRRARRRQQQARVVQAVGLLQGEHLAGQLGRHAPGQPAAAGRERAAAHLRPAVPAGPASGQRRAGHELSGPVTRATAAARARTASRPVRALLRPGAR